MPATLIVRHYKENKKKCTLQPLVGHKGIQFVTYPKLAGLPELSSFFVLALEGDSVLSKKDADKGLLLLDGTWKYAQHMYKALLAYHPLPTRSLPSGYKTAYPRRQTDCSDPERGLASIEALYLAYTQLGWDTKGLLDAYYFKDTFLEKNQLSLEASHF